MSQKTRRQKFTLPADCKCVGCGKSPEQFDGRFHVHHITPLADGGTNDCANLEVRCQPCHVAHHRNHIVEGKNDFQRWGGTGGKVTSDNPFNWMRNLRQFKSWSDEKFTQYVEAKYSLSMVLDEALVSVA